MLSLPEKTVFLKIINEYRRDLSVYIDRRYCIVQMINANRQHVHTGWVILLFVPH